MIISDDELKRFRKEYNSSLMISAISDYCPPEFGELLDYVDYLKAELLKYQHGLFVCPDCGYNVLGSEFLTQMENEDDE